MKRVDIKAILEDPVKRRLMFARAIKAIQNREGIDTTMAQAIAAYGRAEPRRAQGAVNAPRKLSRFDSCPSHQWLEQIEHDHGDHETPVKCIQCQCPGMRDASGKIFWPAT